MRYHSTPSMAKIRLKIPNIGLGMEQLKLSYTLLVGM